MNGNDKLFSVSFALLAEVETFLKNVIAALRRSRFKSVSHLRIGWLWTCEAVPVAVVGDRMTKWSAWKRPGC
jgi:hypothetical protein